MATVVEKVLSRFGIGRKASGETPILNDNAGNLPSIRVYGGSYSGMPGATWTPVDYLRQSYEGYVRNSDVYAAVSLIAQTAKQVKWWDGSGKTKSLLPCDELAKDIGLDPANYRQSVIDGERKLRIAVDPRASVALLERSGGPAFIEQWVSYILLGGNAYTELVRLRPGAVPTMLYLNNPGLVSAEIDRNAEHEDTLVSSWLVRNSYGVRRSLAPYRNGGGDMVQSKLFNPIPGTPYGMAPLQAAMMRVDAQNEAHTLLKRVMQRGYVPGWIEARENSDWGDEQVMRLKENVRQSKFHGEELFLENAIWHPMGFQPGDSGASDLQILTKRDIAAVFHVPPQLIGDTNSQTYSNFKEARRALYMESIIPLLQLFRSSWNRTIGVELKSPLDFDRDSFDAISAAREEAADRATKLWSAGLITRTEARADLEYDPPQPGDEFWGPANFVPMDSDVQGEE
jgi:HK97 family phage portal protein